MADELAVLRDPRQRARLRRTAWTLALIALTFYLGFIVMSVLRARS